MMSEEWSIVMTCLVIFLSLIYWMMTAIKLSRRKIKYLEKLVRLLPGTTKKMGLGRRDVDQLKVH